MEIPTNNGFVFLLGKLYSSFVSFDLMKNTIIVSLPARLLDFPEKHVS